jgi:hypothetical protein
MTSKHFRISALSGFTPIYLQRALNTKFLSPTGIDIPTIESLVYQQGNVNLANILLELDIQDIINSSFIKLIHFTHLHQH